MAATDLIAVAHELAATMIQCAYRKLVARQRATSIKQGHHECTLALHNVIASSARAHHALHTSITRSHCTM